MLAAHLEPYDLIGQWMSHHLAQLIEDANDEARTTPEQRIQIVETILKIWTGRRELPGEFPGQEFDNVFAALDRLGDNSPWAFSRLRYITDDLPNPESTNLPLVATAADLDRLARESVITLITVAFEEALETDREWIDTAEALRAELEGELGSAVGRIRRRLESLRTIPENEPFNPATDEVPVSDPASERPSYASREKPTSNYNHARRLRKMAELLTKVADALYPGAD